MQKITGLLLSIIFVALITNSIQSISADHLEPGEGIFKDENSMNIVPTKDSKYQVHLQVEVRNAQGQLVSVSEVAHGKYLLHEITDSVFDTETIGFFGGKEIITIDNIKYEKVQNTVTAEAHQLPDYSSKGLPMLTYWRIEITAPIDGHGLTVIPFFQANAVLPLVVEDDVVTFRLTILRELN